MIPHESREATEHVREFVLYILEKIIMQTHSNIPKSHQHFVKLIQEINQNNRMNKSGFKIKEWDKKLVDAVKLIWKLEVIQKIAFDQLFDLFHLNGKKKNLLELLSLKELLNVNPGISKICSENYEANFYDHHLSKLEYSYEFSFKFFHYKILDLSLFSTTNRFLKVVTMLLDKKAANMLLFGIAVCEGLKEISDKEISLFRNYNLTEAYSNCDRLRLTHKQVLLNFGNAIQAFNLSNSQILNKNSQDTKKNFVQDSQEKSFVSFKNKLRNISYQSKYLPANNIVFTHQSDEKICEKLNKATQLVYLSSSVGLSQI